MSSPLEFSVEESTETVPGNFNSEGPRAQYQNISVIVAARKSGIGRAVTEGCTINRLRFAAIDMPMPVPQISTPLSALPSPIADVSTLAKSG